MSRLDFAIEEFHPSMPGYLEDPHPFFDRLREAGPVVYVPRLKAYWLLGHAEVSRALSDPAFGVSPNLTPEQVAEMRTRIAQAHTAPAMLFVNPPDHTRLRGLVSKAFTPRTIERLRTHIHDLVDQMLSKAAATGQMDVAEELAFPLPATVIAELLGVPVADQAQFRHWSQAIVRMSDAGSTEEERKDGPAAEMALVQYLAQLIEERRRAPQQDLISDLVAVTENGDQLSHPELVSTCMLLLIAGHETTTGLITRGMHALMLQRDQWERLGADPSLMPTAIEELLRFAAPVERMPRFALKDLELAGIPMKEGTHMLTVFSAANRDPAVFADPHRLDLGRNPNPHVALGKGIHYCLGAPLARLEAQIAFGEMVRRFPGMQSDAERPVVWNGNTRFRSLKSLPVRLG